MNIGHEAARGVDEKAIRTPRTDQGALVRARGLGMAVVDELGNRVRTGLLRAGDKLPTEAGIMEEFGVSRTVVREALSRLQAAGMVRTRQGVGTFVVGSAKAKPFCVDAGSVASLEQAIAIIELRIGLETESAGLASQRRTLHDLHSIGGALAALAGAMDVGSDTAGADFHFHLQIARAAHSPHYAAILEALGPSSVPSSLLEAGCPESSANGWPRDVLREHQSILNALLHQDVDAARAAMRTHLGNSRERLRAAFC